MVTFPRTLPEVRWTSFPLDLERFVSSSRSGNRLTNVVEYADPLWRATLTTKAVHHLGLRPVEAWWSSLREGLRTVLYRHPSYSCPVAHIGSRGPEMQAGTVAAITNGNVVRITGVSAALVLSSGDFITFEQGAARGLGRVVEATGVGASRTVEIEPNLPRLLTTGAVARFDRAELLMRPVPRSFTIEGASVRVASFQLLESRA